VNDWTIRYEPSAPPDDVGAINEGVLEAHFEHMGGDRSRESLPVMVRDAAGRFHGGAVGRVVFGDLHVDAIWVEPALRRSGFGRRILAELEAVARGLACRWAFANTIVPTSRAFFLANGYETFGTVEDIPVGQTLTFLRKPLNRSRLD
jgi:GNAT superfamily N-acetyltransferase